MASEIVNRLRTYRPTNEWGDGVHHVICDESADAIEASRAAVAELVEVLQSRMDALRTGTIEDEMAVDERIRDALSRHQAGLGKGDERG